MKKASRQMKVLRWTRAAWLGGGLTAALVCPSVAGCSDESIMSCGPGTTASGDQCVPITGDASVASDGASGTGGGQSTGGGGGSSTGGAATTGGGGGSATGGGAGTGGTDADAGDASTPTDASDGGPFPGDDPCPTAAMGTFFANCSDSCGEKWANCEAVTCREYHDEYCKNDSIPPMCIHRSDQFPLVIRTPRHPVVTQQCVDYCKEIGKTAFGQVIAINIPANLDDEPPNLPPSFTVRVSVSPPWNVFISSELEPACNAYTTPSTCQTMAYNYGTFTIWSDDPNAPARNVLVERVPGLNTLKCP